MNKSLKKGFYLSYLLLGCKALLSKNGPIFVTFFITSRCNARCGHCLYWDRIGKAENELTLIEILKISKFIPRFPKLLLSGGEPFLRDDVDEICRIFYLNNKVRQITIPTNGICTDRIYEKMNNILKFCPDAAIQVQISIDGAEELHDNMRKTLGAFNRMTETYRLLKELEKRYKNFEINFCFTFSSLNQDMVQDAYDHVRKIGNSSFHLILARKPVKDQNLLEFDIKKYDRWNRMLACDMRPGQMNASERMFAVRRKQQREIICNVVKDEKFRFKCSAGTLTAIIDEAGMVYPCETAGVIFGSLREEGYDFKKIWHSDAAWSFRKKVNSEGCRCTHESNTITNVSFSPNMYLRFLRDYVMGAYI